jgi:tetratricopeptide (TPR) repeat protein
MVNSLSRIVLRFGALGFGLLAASALTPVAARPLTAGEQQQVSSAEAIVKSAMANRDWVAAAGAFRTLLTVKEKALGPDHPEVQSIRETLAIAEQLAGNHERSLALFRMAEAARSKAGEGDTPQFAFIQAGIGVNLNRLGRYAEAETALRRALAIRLKTAGEESRETSFARNELARTLTDSGKYAEAALVFEQMLAAARKAGDEDGIAAALGNLASVEADRGRLDRSALSSLR